VDAGSLDRRLRFEVNQSTADAGYGTPTAHWVTFVTVWGKMKDALPSKSSETADRGIRQAERTTVVTIRYRSDITSDMRIVDIRTGRVMRIVTPPNEIGRADGLEMLCCDYTTSGDAP
jgi:SPP1 family predicted phage head-tail adaptor